jgi:putative oxidoreductase
MRTAAFAALAIAIVIELAWLVQRTFIEHRLPIIYDWAFTLAFAVLFVTGGRLRWLSGLLRIAIGVNFGLAVLDRAGLFGPYGSPGVSWGDWPHFVAYTAQVNSFLPATWAPMLAVAATIYEIVLAITLVLGIRTDIFIIAAAILLFMYGVAMTISMGFASQLPYAVIVLFAGAWVLAHVDATFASLDALRQQRRVAIRSG